MTEVQAAIDEAVKTTESLRPLESAIVQAANLVRECLTSGGKLLVCGNGGSAGDASDFATEFSCRFIDDRRPFPAINLTADGSLLTATGNDYGFDELFARQVRAFGKRGDLLVALTTSGNSRNIIRVLEEARGQGLASIALLGRDGGKARGLSSLDLIVFGPATARIQEAHKFLLHLICSLVEPDLKK